MWFERVKICFYQKAGGKNPDCKAESYSKHFKMNTKVLPQPAGFSPNKGKAEGKRRWIFIFLDLFYSKVFKEIKQKKANNLIKFTVQKCLLAFNNKS